MWRSFAPHVEEHAIDCRSTPESTEPFDIIGGVVGGGSSAVPIRLRSGRLAWAKPARIAGDNADVARERLAFVLGHELGLPVAAVQISRQTETLRNQLPPIVALSFANLAAGVMWNQLRPAPTPDELLALRASFSAMWAFHAWIDDHDHRGEGWNFHVERVSAGTIQVSFFDYGHSLTKQWRPPVDAPTRDWSFRGAYSNPDPLALDQVINHIQMFTLAELQRIVGSLPPDCMPPEVGTALARGLHERGKQLKTLLNLMGTP